MRRKLAGLIFFFNETYLSIGVDCILAVMLTRVHVNVLQGLVAAAPGPSQRRRPQVSVGGFPLKQDSAQVPRRGCKDHRE